RLDSRAEPVLASARSISSGRAAAPGEGSPPQRPTRDPTTMTRRFVFAAASALVAILVGSDVMAQRPGGFGPSGPMPGSGGPGQKPGEEKKDEEGPAEAAPKKPGEVVRAPKGYPDERSGLVNLEMHGYFRFRWDLLHNFNLSVPADVRKIPP